ncbi:MAG TPA: hypothetical protein VGN00_20290 [Puia sp.]|jgi:hypothetical protein
MLGILITVLGGLITILGLFDGFKKDDKLSFNKILRFICALSVIGLGVYSSMTQTAKIAENQKILIDTTARIGESTVAQIDTSTNKLFIQADTNTTKVITAEKKVLNKLDSTRIIYRDTSYGNTVVSLWNTESIKLKPTNSANKYSLEISFASSSNNVENFSTSGCLIIESERLNKSQIFHLIENGSTNDFVKSQIAKSYSIIDIGRFSISQDSMFLYVKYNWKNKQHKGKEPERRLLTYYPERGFFAFVPNASLPNTIWAAMIKNGYY